MTNIGRPQTHGVQPGWMLFRIVQVLYCYQEQRRRGIKFRSAVQETITYIRTHFKGMPISESTVKRILAQTHSKQGNLYWVIRPSNVPTVNNDGLSICLEPFEPYLTQAQLLRQHRSLTKISS